MAQDATPRRRISSLLVFPEGTRTATGELGPFHTGPLRLAQELGVPVLPVAVVGTRDVLPKGGRLRPGPVEVRLGQAIQPGELDIDDMGPVVDQIRALLAQGPPTPAVAGSVAGALVTRGLVRRGLRPPAPLTSHAMHDRADQHMAAGAAGVWHQAANAVPVKLYAAAADLEVPAASFALHTALARGVRAVVLGQAVRLSAKRVQPFLRRAYGAYLLGLCTAYATGLALVVRRWRRL